MNKELFDKGMKIRREVLGNKAVDAAMNNADDFFMPFQEFVTQYCWGEVWGRPGLDRKTRSLLNLAMIASLNRPSELRLHIKGALNNGVTKEDMVEVFLQVAVYAGVPAGLECFRIAREVFTQEGI